MKQAGYFLLAVGFLAGAFMTVQEENRINWFTYAPCAAAMLAGLIFVQISRAQTDAHAGRSEGNLQTMQTSLSSLVVKLEALQSGREDSQVDQIRHTIDNEFMEDLNNFVEVRETLIHRFGMQHYAELMSAFARSERLINRAWSASADGYVEEVWKSLDEAHLEMTEARDLLETYLQPT